MRSSWSVSVYLCVCEQDKSESENCKRISMKVSELTAYGRSQRVIWLVFRVLFPGNTESADFVLSAGCLKRVSMSVF